MKGMLVVDGDTRARFERDVHRPTYHFLPPKNWMNDPNGLIHWKGIYHLFYQHNPHAADWGPMHWGHATSIDLIHWTHQPVAMQPDPDSPDQDGCWSGCAVDQDGIPTILYSGNRDGQQRCCLAHSQDDLAALEKFAGNPVIPNLPQGYDIFQYRDHCAWREGNTWNQLIGSGIPGRGGTVFLYRSPDLVHWELSGPILTGDELPSDTLPAGSMWECPDLIPLGNRHILVVSVFFDRPDYTGYFLGNYRDGRFYPDTFQKMDYGDTEYYAPQSFVNEAGERIQFGWINESRSVDWNLEAGWAGVLSLPRLLWLGQDDRLRVKPHPNVDLLRGEHWSVEGLRVTGSMVATGFQGPALELRAVFAAGSQAEQYGLQVCCAPDGSEWTGIVYDRAAGRLKVERAHSSLDPRAVTVERGGPLVLDPDEDLDLRIYLDGSVIEIYAQERQTLTCRVYPTQPGSQGVRLFASGGEAWLKRLDAWRMQKIW